MNIFYKVIITFCLSAICSYGNAQTTIQMEEYGGVYRIPCKVNGAKMKLIFDTGANNVCLSLTMAEYLFDNDLISKDDIIGRGSSTVADGSIVDHIKINIKDIEIQGIHLKNVEAVVIDGQNAPLLLGQSAIKKLGKWSISGNKLIIASGQKKNVALTKAEIDRLIVEADNAYKDEAYYVALDKYGILYEKNQLSLKRILKYANCCLKAEKDDEALEACLSIQDKVEKTSPTDKAELYYLMGICYTRMHNDDLAVKFIEQSKYYAKPWSKQQLEAVVWLSVNYGLKNDYLHATLILEDYISKYLTAKKLKPTDCWEKSLSDEFLGGLYYNLYTAFEFGKEDEKYLVLSAAWGDKNAQDLCDEFDLNYSSKRNMYKYTY